MNQPQPSTDLTADEAEGLFLLLSVAIAIISYTSVVAGLLAALSYLTGE